LSTNKRPFLKKKNVNNYLKYSGLAFQLLGLCLFGVLAGKQIDKFFKNEKPIATLLLVVFLFIGYFYKLVRELSNEK